MSTVEIAQSPLPADAVEKYGGKWVAIRDGEVIAAADEFDELVASEEVRGTDLLTYVPPAGTYFY